jgi:hypothetical protein
MKSENHETCLGVMLWHVEAVCKNWEDFKQVWTSDASNLDAGSSAREGKRGGPIHLPVCRHNVLVRYKGTPHLVPFLVAHPMRLALGL